MVKTQVIPCSQEEMKKIIDASMSEPFYFMLFTVAKLTGRRLGELYGSQETKEIGRKIIGNKIEYDREGKAVPLSKTRAIVKKIPNQWKGGVKLQDIDLEKGIMKVWVLKRGNWIQDESILNQEAIQSIKFYLAGEGKDLKKSDYLFRKVSYRGIQDAIDRISKQAGINHKVSMHSFRHYLITELKRLGWTNDKISKLTGHKTPTSLVTYDHVVASDIKAEVLRDLKEL